jgi:hypothetical protein
MRNRSIPMLGALLAISLIACWNEPNQPAAMLLLTRAPSGWAQNRELFSVRPIAQLADADGDVVLDVHTKITVAITSGEGTLLGVTTVGTDTLGAATFEDLTLVGPVGAKTLSFSSPGLLSARSSINLAAGVAASLGVHDGNDQSAARGTAVGTPPSVIVTDLDGNPVGRVIVSFAVASGGGSVTEAHPRTDSMGVASVGSWRLGPATGNNTLMALGSGLIGTVTFTAQGTTEPPAGTGCFIDERGRTYCVDPGPLDSQRAMGR